MFKTFTLPLAAIGAFACSGVVESGEPLALDASPPASGQPSTGAMPTAPPPPATDPLAPKPVEEQDAPAVFGVAALRQLSVREYERAVTALLKSPPPALSLEKDVPLSGLTAIGNVESAMSERASESFEAAAQLVAEQFVASTATCEAAAPGCFEEFVRSTGRQVWRRPLTEEEVARYVTLATEASQTLAKPAEGLVFALSGLLQSPHFLYRVELGEPDAQVPGRRRLSDHELATRLSFFLTGAPPDAQLALSADAGTVRAQVAEHAARLIASTPAREAASFFLGEYMNLQRLEATEKSAELFPSYDDSLRAAMLEQTRRTLSEFAFTEGMDFRQLFTTRRTFLNGPLMGLYGLDSSGAPPSGDLVAYEFAANHPRVGLLGNASFLAINAHVSNTSPSLRGKFVREVLLCQGIPAPPPDVVTELPALGDNIKTNRQRFEQHSINPACSGCHSLMDPIGLGFENFDGIGAYRETENGEVIDASGDLDGAPYNGLAALAQLLADHPNLTKCLVQTTFRHASGGFATPLEEPLLAELNESFAAQAFSLPLLLLSSATHPTFGFVREPRLTAPPSATPKEMP